MYSVLKLKFHLVYAIIQIKSDNVIPKTSGRPVVEIRP